MAETVFIKRDDLDQLIIIPLTENGVAFDFSDPKWLARVTAIDAETLVTLYKDRDVTAYQVTPASPIGGLFGVPLFSGEGALSPLTTVVTGAGDVVTVTVPTAAAPENVAQVRIYMSKAGAPGVYFLVASGGNGFAAGGIPVGDPAFVPPVGVTATWLTAPGDDTVLEQLTNPNEESITNGETVAVAIPLAPGTVLSTPGTGTLTVGSHDFIVTNLRTSDTVIERRIDLEAELFDKSTGRPRTLPGVGGRRLEITQPLA